MKSSLDGHMPASDPLSVRSARGAAIFLADYDPRSLWDSDTARLPRALRAYRRKLRSFADQHLRPLALGADLGEGAGAELARTQVLPAAAAAGLLSDALPYPFGSTELRQFVHPLQFAACLKMEELCAACGGLGLILGAHTLGTAPIILSGKLGDLRRFLVPAYRRSMSGTPTVFAFALTEPSGGSDVEDSHGASHYRPLTRARPVPGGYVLNGRKVFISGGDIADRCTVFCALEGEGMASWSCFCVDTRSEGFRVVRTEHKMGQRASGAAELEFDQMFVPEGDVVGTLRKGWSLNRVTLNFSRLPAGAIALGIARGALEATVEFACRNRLGRRTLMDYQEVQLGIAEMIAETAAMRALLWQSAAVFTPTQAAASMAKFYCADRAVAVCTQAMDLLGNHALLHAHRVEKGFRDARLTQIYEGTNQINRLAVIEDLQEQFLEQINRRFGSA